MNKTLFSTLFIGFSAVALGAAVAAPDALEVKVFGVEKNRLIPSENAYCHTGKDGKSEKGLNQRPAVTWSKGPEGTKSYAIFMIDPDVPVDFTDAGKVGKIIPENMKRQDFFHWAQIDISANAEGFPAGSGNDYPEQQPDIGRAGVNSYAEFYKNKPKGEYTGYDGMCPPWNDERIHHYHFQVYALDVNQLALAKEFTAKEAYTAIQPHILAKGEIVGTYTLNPERMKK